MGKEVKCICRRQELGMAHGHRAVRALKNNSPGRIRGNFKVINARLRLVASSSQIALL